MMRAMAFTIIAFATLILVATGKNVENIDVNINLVFPESTPKEADKICAVEDVQTFSHKYHNCFIDRKYKDGGQDLENLVARILEHSKICVENATRSCRPNLKGFVAMMDQVIYQMKDYFHIYMEHLNTEKIKINDLECMEGLVISTYQSCFKEAFKEVADTSSNKFQQKVESAISCANKSHKSCSGSAKTSFNKVVSQILHVKQPEKEDIKIKMKQPEKEDIKIERKQPEKEDIEIEVKQPEPPKRWYDIILQPFVSMWHSIRTFFGF